MTTDTTDNPGLTVAQLARLLGWTTDEAQREMSDPLSEEWVRPDGRIEEWVPVEIAFLAELAVLHEVGQLDEAECDALWTEMRPAFPQLGAIMAGRQELPADADPVLVATVNGRKITLRFFETTLRDTSLRG
jgi:hypothetical protein